MPEIVVLSGAGLSAESGLGTFRDIDGLWSRFSLADVASPEGYVRDPSRVLEFYNLRRANCAEAAPNAAHRALARLQNGLGSDLLLVTQNIDNLLERAGVTDAVHMHGTLMEALCAHCSFVGPAAKRMATTDLCPRCGQAALRPNVVWFGEMPYHMERIEKALLSCRWFVSVGTSGSVYPAAGFVQIAASAGAHCLEINLERSDTADDFDDHRHGAATELVPEWVDDFLSERSIRT